MCQKPLPSSNTVACSCVVFYFYSQMSTAGEKLQGYILHRSNIKWKIGGGIKNTSLLLCKCMVIEPLSLMLPNTQAQNFSLSDSLTWTTSHPHTEQAQICLTFCLPCFLYCNDIVITVFSIISGEWFPIVLVFPHILSCITTYSLCVTQYC